MLILGFLVHLNMWNPYSSPHSLSTLYTTLQELLSIEDGHMYHGAAQKRDRAFWEAHPGAAGASIAGFSPHRLSSPVGQKLQGSQCAHEHKLGCSAKFPETCAWLEDIL